MASLKVEKNKLYITQSCGILAVFGIPLAVIGLVILQLSAVSIEIYGLGLLVLLLGLMIIAGRKGVILDRESSRIIRWWGLWKPLIRTFQSLDNHDKVVVHQHLQGGNNTISYPIQLISNKALDSKVSPIYESTDLLESRTFSEHIARYLGKPLENSSIGTPVIYQPVELQKNIIHQSKLKLQKQNLSSNNPINKNQITVSKTASGIEISLLPCGLMNAFLMFIPHGIVATIIGIFIMGNVDSDFIQQSLNGIIVFSFLAVIGLIYRCFTIGHSVSKVVIDNKTIKIYQQGLVNQSEHVVNIQALEELFISELSFRIFPIFTGNVLSLIASTHTIDIVGIKSTEALYQLKQIISESIGFEWEQTKIADFELQNS